MLKCIMLSHPVDIYYNNALQPGNEQDGARRVFSFLELLYANNTPAPWDAWFEQRSGELNLVIKRLQDDSAYSLYAEHLLAGMPYWNVDNLNSPAHVENLRTYAVHVVESTWHALGQRDDGRVLIAMLAAIEASTGREFMQDAMRSSPHAAAIGFYNGFLEMHTRPLNNDEYSSELYVWSSRICSEPLPLTTALFCSKYPEVGFLWAANALKQSNKQKALLDTENAITRWAVEQPVQSQALYSYLMYERHYWGKPDEALFSLNVDEIQSNAALIKSIYPEILSIGQYVRVYVELFNTTSPRIEASLGLPLDFNA